MKTIVTTRLCAALAFAGIALSAGVAGAQDEPNVVERDTRPYRMVGPVEVPAGMPDGEDLVVFDGLPDDLTAAPDPMFVELDENGDPHPDGESEYEFVMFIEHVKGKAKNVEVNMLRVRGADEKDDWVVPDIGDIDLAPGEALAVRIVFAPQEAGDFAGTFEIRCTYRTTADHMRAAAPGIARVATSPKHTDPNEIGSDDDPDAPIDGKPDAPIDDEAPVVDPIYEE